VFFFFGGGGGSVHLYVEGSVFSAFHIRKATQCFNLPLYLELLQVQLVVLVVTIVRP